VVLMRKEKKVESAKEWAGRKVGALKRDHIFGSGRKRQCILRRAWREVRRVGSITRRRVNWGKKGVWKDKPRFYPGSVGKSHRVGWTGKVFGWRRIQSFKGTYDSRGKG